MICNIHTQKTTMVLRKSRGLNTSMGKNGQQCKVPVLSRQCAHSFQLSKSPAVEKMTRCTECKINMETLRAQKSKGEGCRAFTICS